jgi:hypothetical protein
MPPRDIIFGGAQVPSKSSHDSPLRPTTRTRRAASRPAISEKEGVKSWVEDPAKDS